ncbi:MAG TPA: histidine phosphatase family protein [Methylomirabilota bacterium]|nr:histidine phosphatase family protein [Methylomirabilota bacterium]
MNNLTTFYLVRHGQTDWNKNKKIQGQLDIPLNPTGEGQARDIAGKFKDINFDLAFSSDLLRAKQTTEIILLERKLAIQTTKLLRERDFGKLEGQPSAALLTYSKLLTNLNDEERKHHRMAEGIENDKEVIARVITFLRETAVTHPGKTILVTTHGGILRMLLIHLGSVTYNDFELLQMTNGGFLKLTSDGVDFFIKDIFGLEKRPEGSEEL